MKRIVVTALVVAFAVTSLAAYSGSAIFAPQWELYTQNSDGYPIQMQTLGLSYGVASSNWDPWGSFVMGDLQFPIKVEFNGSELDEWDYATSVSCLVGLARFTRIDNTTLYAGVGAAWMMNAFAPNEYLSLISIDVGLGVAIGVLVPITRTMSVAVGAESVYSFAQHAIVMTGSGDSSDWVEDFSSINSSVHVGVSFDYMRSEGKYTWGR